MQPQTGVIKQSHEANKITGLDVLRAIAISTVFLYHYGGIYPHPEWVRNSSKFGWTGVDLFFVLSGFLIASQLFSGIEKNNKVPLREFFIKRFFRIIPAYMLVVAVYFLFPALREREGPAPLWKYLTFTQNLGLDLRTQGTFSHAWSLCIEEQFYLCLPLILAALIYFKALKKGLIVLCAFFLLGFLARLYCWYNLVAPLSDDDSFGIYWYKWIYYPTWSRLDGLLVGVSIAGIFQFRPVLKERLLRYSNLLLITGIAILTMAYFLCVDTTDFTASIFGFPLIALGYGVLVAGAISPKSILARLAFRPVITIATLSYALYLTHKIVIHTTQQQIGKTGISKDGNWMLVICMISSIFIAWLIHRAIERPFLWLRNRVLRRR